MNDALKIKIKYHADIERIKKIEVGDWIDLRAAEDVFIPQGESMKISLGVSMQLPDGYEAIVAPRSSTFKNYGIIMVNSIGIIDNTYCGTNDIWQFPAYCLIGRDFVDITRDGKMIKKVGSAIRKGERICQFRIQKVQPEVVFEECETLGEDRGGFGSTGKE